MVRPRGAGGMIPEGYRWVRREGGVRLLLAPDLAPEDVPEPGEGEAVRPGVARGGLRRLTRNGRVLWVRRYRHGGLVGPLLADRYGGPRRGVRELRILAHLCRGRVAVPEPAFLEVRPAGVLVRMRLGTWDLPGRPLTEALAGPATGRRAAAREAGRAVRRLHDAGVVHGDLHIGNVLWDGRRAGILDLDSARFPGVVGAEARWGEILRLLRSARKRRASLACSNRDALRFLDAYAGGDRGWREGLHPRLVRFERGLRLHSVLWGRGDR